VLQELRHGAVGVREPPRITLLFIVLIEIHPEHGRCIVDCWSIDDPQADEYRVPVPRPADAEFYSSGAVYRTV
jgi:hypothetical protein